MKINKITQTITILALLILLSLQVHGQKVIKETKELDWFGWDFAKISNNQIATYTLIPHKNKTLTVKLSIADENFNVVKDFQFDLEKGHFYTINRYSTGSKFKFGPIIFETCGKYILFDIGRAGMNSVANTIIIDSETGRHWMIKDGVANTEGIADVYYSPKYETSPFKSEKFTIFNNVLYCHKYNFRKKYISIVSHNLMPNDKRKQVKVSLNKKDILHSIYTKNDEVYARVHTIKGIELINLTKNSLGNSRKLIGTDNLENLNVSRVEVQIHDSTIYALGYFHTKKARYGGLRIIILEDKDVVIHEMYFTNNINLGGVSLEKGYRTLFAGAGNIHFQVVNNNIYMLTEFKDIKSYSSTKNVHDSYPFTKDIGAYVISLNGKQLYFQEIPIPIRKINEFRYLGFTKSIIGISGENVVFDFIDVELSGIHRIEFNTNNASINIKKIEESDVRDFEVLGNDNILSIGYDPSQNIKYGTMKPQLLKVINPNE